MSDASVGRVAAVLFAIGWAGTAVASDPCAMTAVAHPAADAASRIAAIACEENRLWFSPFIDSSGRLAQMRVTEAEEAMLADGNTRTWRRVAGYWRATGLLAPMARFEGANACAGPLEAASDRAACRSFLVDTPWSAVFVSYVLSRAGVTGFRPSVRHIDFVRDAHRSAGRGPYVLMDPQAASPEPGDLLCFTRVASPALGHAGLVEWLDSASLSGIEIHCDIVVASSRSRAYAIGGNVLQGVTMRVLPLNRLGRLWGVQRQSEATSTCGPGNEAACSFNRQDWVALLRFRPTAVPGGCCPDCTASGPTFSSNPINSPNRSASNPEALSACSAPAP